MRVLTWIREKVVAFLRLAKPPCPSCGSRGHEQHEKHGYDVWQCAACGEEVLLDGLRPHCWNCGSEHLDSIRKCPDCGRVFNPRFEHTREVVE